MPWQLYPPARFGDEYCGIAGSDEYGPVYSGDVVHGEEILANCGVLDRG